MALALLLATCQACGADAEQPLQIVIARGDALMFPPETVEVLVYGSRAVCSSLEAAAPTANDDQCTPGADEEAGTCFLASANMAYQQGAKSERLVVSKGHRNVLVRGLDSFSDVESVGCSAVTVKDGEVTSVTVRIDDVP